MRNRGRMAKLAGLRLTDNHSAYMYVNALGPKREGTDMPMCYLGRSAPEIRNDLTRTDRSQCTADNLVSMLTFRYAIFAQDIYIC